MSLSPHNAGRKMRHFVWICVGKVMDGSEDVDVVVALDKCGSVWWYPSWAFSRVFLHLLLSLNVACGD